MAFSSERLASLREMAAQYESTIASFEEMNAKLLVRRRGASDSIMVHVDESLAINERTITIMRRGLEIVRQQLRQLGG